MATYDRYNKFRTNGTITKVPFVKLTPKSTDYFEIYKRGFTRLDLISYNYYGDANYDWLIMLANAKYGSLEFNIPDGAELRIPYPLNVTLEDYKNKIDSYSYLYKL